MRSLDYNAIGQRESTDLSVKAATRGHNHRGASGTRTGGKQAGRDGDAIVYSPPGPHQLTEDAPLPQSAQSLDEVVKLPAQAFGKKQSGALALAPALSQDRLAQQQKHLQQLTSELQSSLQQQLKTHQTKVDKFAEEQQAIVDGLKEQEAKEKKSGARPTYEQQKDAETKSFKRRSDVVQKNLEQDSEKLQMVAKVLQELGQRDKTYSGLLNTVSNAITQVAANQRTSVAKDHRDLHQAMGGQAQEFFRRYNNVKARNATSDKVLSEMKKQMGCYKDEIDNMQKMETHMTAENYQKLVNDFNQLYDHYKLHKVTAKKLKAELFQSNHRERTFLNLLKNTQEYGE